MVTSLLRSTVISTREPDSAGEAMARSSVPGPMSAPRTGACSPARPCAYSGGVSEAVAPSTRGGSISAMRRHFVASSDVSNRYSSASASGSIRRSNSSPSIAPVSASAPRSDSARRSCHVISSRRSPVTCPSSIRRYRTATVVSSGFTGVFMSEARKRSDSPSAWNSSGVASAMSVRLGHDAPPSGRKTRCAPIAKWLGVSSPRSVITASATSERTRRLEGGRERSSSPARIPPTRSAIAPALSIARSRSARCVAVSACSFLRR